jgi:hypothetical protein
MLLLWQGKIDKLRLKYKSAKGKTATAEGAAAEVCHRVVERVLASVGDGCPFVEGPVITQVLSWLLLRLWK